MRERVEDAARSLGYHGPDPKGRLLRAGKVNAIGVVVMDDLTYFFNDPFNREFMTGVAEVCDQRGAGIALVSAADREKAAWNIDSALVDGFIIQCIEDGDRLIELARRRRLPFVAVDVDPGPDASSILIDDRGGARHGGRAPSRPRSSALRHPVARDRRRRTHRAGRPDRAAPRRSTARPATGCSATRTRSAQRLAFLVARAVRRLRGRTRFGGIAIDDVPIIEAINDRKGAAEGARMLLDARPRHTAVLAMSDVLALAVVDEARAAGSGFPKTSPWSAMTTCPRPRAADPPLTTIAQPIVEKGRLAAQMIFDPRPAAKGDACR